MKSGMWFVGLLSIVAWGVQPPSARAAILINELLADPSSVTGDANQDGVVSTTQDEFIELVNSAAADVSLANWQLSDAVQVRHTFSSTAAIPGFGFYVVFGGGSPNGFLQAAVASSGGLSLNNTSETVTLKDANSLLIDTVTYGSEGGADVSLTRFPDAIGQFVKHTSVSPNPFSAGTTVEGLAQLSHAEPPHAEPPNEDPHGDSPTAAPASLTTPEPSSLMWWGIGMIILLGRTRWMPANASIF